MIKFAAGAGAIDEEKVVLESLGAIKRAGADLIFSYFALDLAGREKDPPLNPPLPVALRLPGLPNLISGALYLSRPPHRSPDKALAPLSGTGANQYL